MCVRRSAKKELEAPSHTVVAMHVRGGRMLEHLSVPKLKLLNVMLI